MRIQQNGIDLYTQANQYQSRCKPYSAKIIDILIKDIGVIASATAHQNKTQNDKGDTDEHKGIVLFLEDKFLLWRLKRLMFLFFTHGTKL